MIFDSHAHYDDERFDEDREMLLDSMESRGIGYIVEVSSTYESCRKSIEMAKRFPRVYASVGVHPNEVGSLDEEKFQAMKKLVHKPKVVAIGEIGIDYYWKEPSPEVQKYWFEKQLDLAREAELPVIIHSRDAAAETMEVLKAKHAEELGGIIHYFSYSPEMAQEYVNMGFYIGVGGVVTFKNSKKLKEVVDAISLESIVIETDSPYLSPEPYRGKRNSSLHLPYVVSAIAEIKGVTPQEVIDITRENAKKVYRIH